MSVSPILGQGTLPLTFLETTYNGQLYKSFQFESDEFLSYQIQVSQDLKIWSDLATFQGFNETVVFPFAPIPQNGQTTNTPSQNPNPPVVITLERAIGGGTVMTWNSLDNQAPKKSFAPGITLGSHWDAALFFSQQVGLYSYFVSSPPGSAVAAPSQEPELTAADINFRSEFINSGFTALDSAIQNQTPSNNTLSPYPISNGSYFRVKTQIADEDSDGLPDETEQTPPTQGGTGTDHQNPDSDGDGVWDGAEVAQGTDPNDPLSKPTSTIPNVEPPENGQAPSAVGSIKKISFHENHDLTSDSQKVNYKAPHWNSESHNFPVSYSRTLPVVLSAEFELDDTNFYWIDVSATLPNGVLLLKTPLTQEGTSNTWILPPTACGGLDPDGDGPLPQEPKTIADAIKFYSAQAQAGEESYEITWSFHLDGGDAEPIGTTKHTMYVTDGEPILGDSKPDPERVIRQETVFYLACKNAAGKSVGKGDSILDIGKSIYLDFQDRDVQKVIPAQAVQDGIALTYWGDPNGDGVREGEGQANGAGICQLGTKLLADPERNGACTAWVHFLSDTFRVHGFSTIRLQITPKNLQERRFIVNNVILGQPANLNPDGTNPLYDNYHYIEGINVNFYGNPRLGKDGQGASRTNIDPSKIFGNHFILKFQDALFDPSYGSKVYENEVGQPQKDLLKEYEDENIALYALPIVGGNFPYIYRTNNTHPAGHADAVGAEIFAMPFDSDAP